MINYPKSSADLHKTACLALCLQPAAVKRSWVLASCLISAFNLLFLSSRVSRRMIYLFVLLLDLCLHLLQLLLAFIGTHPQALPQHADAKDGKESSGHIVCVDSGDDGRGIAKQHWGEKKGAHRN